MLLHLGRIKYLASNFLEFIDYYVRDYKGIGETPAKVESFLRWRSASLERKSFVVCGLAEPVTVPGSVLQLSGDDSTSITKLEEKERKEEKVANASRWSLSDQMGTLSGKGVSVMGSSTGSSTESLAR